MKLEDLLKKVNLTALIPEATDYSSEVSGCYIGDLLSNVMGHAQKGEIWLTVQTHPNVVAIAHLLELSGIVFVEGHQPQEETIEKARQEKIPLFSTGEKAFQVACFFYEAGLGSVPR